MTYAEKILIQIDQKLNLNNKMLSELLENIYMMQKDLEACTKSITSSNMQTVKESRARTQQMMKMLIESKIKKEK